METLQNKIDFEYIIYADKCNPNGDPNNGNRPREDFDGYGEISDVCIKRKLRNYLHETGENIIVLPTELTGKSLMNAVKESDLNKYIKDKSVSQDIFLKEACKRWYDVRTFGMIFPFKSNESSGVSCSTKGTASISFATSLDIIKTRDISLLNGLNRTLEDKRENNTMGIRGIVDKAVYVGTGSMFPQMAEKNCFTNDDAEKLKQAILHMFDYDACSARPAGSMTLCELHWWIHDCPNGRYAPMKVFNSITVKQKEEYPFYEVIENYELENVKHEVYKNI